MWKMLLCFYLYLYSLLIPRLPLNRDTLQTVRLPSDVVDLSLRTRFFSYVWFTSSHIRSWSLPSMATPRCWSRRAHHRQRAPRRAAAHGGQKQPMHRIGLKTPPFVIGTTLECLAITKDIGSCSSSARCSRSVALAEASPTTGLSLTSAGSDSPRHTRSRCSRSPSQHVKPSPLFSLHYCCLPPFFAVLERLDFFQSSFDAIPPGCMGNLAVNFVLGRSDGFSRLPAK
jgi:hypothetical protein